MWFPSVAGRRRVWFAVAVATSLTGAVAWLRWHADSTGEIHQAYTVVSVAPGAVRQLLPSPSQALVEGSHYQAATGAAGTAGTADVPDPAGSAPDLKRVFDDYISRGDPRRRRLAVRAFEACVPTFLPSAGQMPSPEPLIAALPPDQRAERETAYRALFARCHRLLAEGRASLDGIRQALERDPQSQAPGLRAQEALLVGGIDRIEPLVAEALSSADPADVGSLAGIAARIVQSRWPDGADAALLQRAREIDTALSFVACDLGLDCAALSLWALQICAAEGLCGGDFSARLMARVTPGSVNPVAVQQQRLRLLGLIRSGRTLETADLLPP